MLREELKNIPSSVRDLRHFGLTMAAVLLVIAAILWWKEKASCLYFACPALVLGALGLLAPAWLRPLQRAWMALAVLMGFVMNRVILSVVFFGMFAPAALLCKLLRKDLLRERWDKTAESYWLKRAPQSYQPRNSEKMY